MLGQPQVLNNHGRSSHTRNIHVGEPAAYLNMHLILTGATGLVGSAVLHNMIITPGVTKISVLSRRPVALAEGQPKVNVLIHKDFSSYPSELLSQVKDADGVVWALGISATQVGKEYVSLSPSARPVQRRVLLWEGRWLIVRSSHGQGIRTDIAHVPALLRPRDGNDHTPQAAKLRTYISEKFICSP